MSSLGNWVRGFRPIVEYYRDQPPPENFTLIDRNHPLILRVRVPFRQLVANAALLSIAGLLLYSTGHFSATSAVGIAGAIWIGTIIERLIRVGWTIRLEREGVVLSAQRNTIICPWALFDCDGTPNGDYFFERMLLPIREEYVDDIIKQRGNRVVGRGLKARDLQVGFPGSSKIFVRGNYGVDFTELAGYISRLAFGAAPHAADSTIENAAFPLPQPIRPGSRWRLIDLSRIKLPSACCGCLSPDFRWRDVEATNWMAMALHMPHKTVTLPLPICSACERKRVRTMLYAGGMGYLAGFVLFALLLYLDQRQIDWWTVLGAAVLALAPAGLIVLAAFSFTIFVRLARFSDRRQTVRIWVRNRDFWLKPAVMRVSEYEVDKLEDASHPV